MTPAQSGQNRQRSIIVTGCSSGIGAYCAEALHERGWRVFATARKDADIAALKAKGMEAHYLDYTEPQSIAVLADEVLRQTDGKLDALFNNGAYAQPGAIEDLPVEALRQQFEANFFGWHDLTRRVVPVMRRQGHGRIVHCSSILGLVPMKWRGAYVASKFALEGLMLAQRMELEGSGIDVSLIEPGPIASRFTYNAASHARANIDMEASVHRELLPAPDGETGRRRYKIQEQAWTGSRLCCTASCIGGAASPPALCGDETGETWVTGTAPDACPLALPDAVRPVMRSGTVRMGRK